MSYTDYTEIFTEFKEYITGDGVDLFYEDKDFQDLYFYCKYLNFLLRTSYILMEIEAYYKIETTFSFLKSIPLQIEDRLNISGVFDTLRDLPDYYSITLIKSIDNSEYDQEELIDCIAQNNKKEFLEILRRERYDITLLTQICSLCDRGITNIGMIIPEDFANMTDEGRKKLNIKSNHYIRVTIGDEAAEQHLNDDPALLSQMIQDAICHYWQENERYTTTEKNILEGIVDEIRNTPLYLELYEQFHKDGVFYPDGVEGTDIEEAEVEAVVETNSLTESSKESINTTKKYEGEVPLYCQNKDRSGKKPLKLDEYYTNDRSRVMTLLEALAENEFIWAGEINSFYTHLTGFGDNDNVSKKLHWRKGNIRDLSFFIFLMYPYECNNNVRYDPIKEYIEYKHEFSSYDNGTKFASAATRPTLELKKLLRKLYRTENKRPIRYDKM